MRKNGNSHTLALGCKMALSLQKTLLSSTTVQDMIPYNSAILLFNIFISFRAPSSNKEDTSLMWLV